ncbi:MAG: hypothetical protein ACK4N4_15295 [Burkholderiales bacterium]
MRFGVLSSAEARFYTEQAHQLRNEYFAQQLERAMAALSRLLRGLRRAKAATGALVSRQHGSAA